MNTLEPESNSSPASAPGARVEQSSADHGPAMVQSVTSTPLRVEAAREVLITSCRASVHGQIETEDPGSAGEAAAETTPTSSHDEASERQIRNLSKEVEDLRAEAAATKADNDILRAGLASDSKSISQLDGSPASHQELEVLSESIEREVVQLRRRITVLESKERKLARKNDKLEQDNHELKDKVVVAVRDMQTYKDEATKLNDKRLLQKLGAKSRKHGRHPDNSEETPQETLETTIRDLKSDLDDCRTAWATAQNISNMRIGDLERLNEILANSVTAQAVRMGLAEVRADLFKEKNAEMLANALRRADPKDKAVTQARAEVEAARKDAAITTKGLQKLAKQKEDEVRELRLTNGEEEDVRAEVEGKLKQAKEELFEASNTILGYEIEQAAMQKELDRCEIAKKAAKGRFTSWVSLVTPSWTYIKRPWIDANRLIDDGT